MRMLAIRGSESKFVVATKRTTCARLQMDAGLHVPRPIGRFCQTIYLNGLLPAKFKTWRGWVFLGWEEGQKRQVRQLKFILIPSAPSDPHSDALCS